MKRWRMYPRHPAPATRRSSTSRVGLTAVRRDLHTLPSDTLASSSRSVASWFGREMRSLKMLISASQSASSSVPPVPPLPPLFLRLLLARATWRRPLGVAREGQVDGPDGPRLDDPTTVRGNPRVGARALTLVEVDAL